MYNFIGSGGVNYGHPGVFLNAEDQDNYDFVYFRFVAIYTRVRGKMSLFWFQIWATIWILKNLLMTSSVYGNDFGVLEVYVKIRSAILAETLFSWRGYAINLLGLIPFASFYTLFLFISQASFIQRMFSDGLRLQRSTKIWRSKVRLLPQRSPQGGRMVQHQGGSVELHTCRGSEGLPQRHIGDVIQPALSNQKTWWCLGCQWLQ